MNTSKCGTCENFDQVIRGIKPTTWGWCVKKSTYPYKEGPGQVFPTGAIRAEPGEHAQPCIVRKTEVMTNCTLYTIRQTKANKQELVAKLLSDSTGRVILR